MKKCIKKMSACVLGMVLLLTNAAAWAQEAKFVQIDGGFGLKDDGTVWKLPLYGDAKLNLFDPIRFPYGTLSDEKKMTELTEFYPAVKISATVRSLEEPRPNFAALKADGTLYTRLTSFLVNGKIIERTIQTEDVKEFHAGEEATIFVREDGTVWIWGKMLNGFTEPTIDLYSDRTYYTEPTRVWNNIENPRSIACRAQVEEGGGIIDSEGRYKVFGYQNDRSEEKNWIDLDLTCHDPEEQGYLNLRFNRIEYGNLLWSERYFPRPYTRTIGILENGYPAVGPKMIGSLGKVKDVDLGEIGEVQDCIYFRPSESAMHLIFPLPHYVVLKEDGTVWESGCLFPHLKEENGMLDVYTENWYPIRGLEHVVDIDVIGANILALQEDGTIINWCQAPQIVSTETPRSLKGRYCAFRLSTESDRMVYNDDVYEIDPGRGTKPVERDGRTYLPIRNLVEKARGTVVWDAETETVTAKLWDHEVQMQLGSNTVKVDGQEKIMDAIPFEENGRTMVPVRFLAEGFGFDVEWDEPSQSVRLYYKELLGQ